VAVDIILLGCSIIMGILALIFQKLIIVLATSFCGAYAVSSGVYQFIVNYTDSTANKEQLSTILIHMLENHTFDIKDMTANWVTWVFLGICVLLAVFGALVQFKVTGKHYHHHHHHGHDHEREPLIN